MPFNQPLRGRVEPNTPSWSRATAADREAFYRRAGELAVAEKRGELSRAIGANGRRFRPRKHPRPDGANGPVLTPHGDDSRTARLLTYRAWGDGLTLFWHAGIGRSHSTPWGDILGYHAAGAGSLPRRDTRLSTRGLGKVRKEMADWWSRRAAAKTKEANRATAASQATLTRKYPGLGAYFRRPGEGF
jgi:hypothetical protein